jgi:hypothetical protein
MGLGVMLGVVASVQGLVGFPVVMRSGFVMLRRMLMMVV